MDKYQAMRIDVISDVVCPWCYIGKRNLESALSLWQSKHTDEPAPEVIWHPFQLNPQLPESGVPRREYLEQKFGGPDRAREIYARVTAAGARAGITFDFDRIEAQPNTVNPHRLLHYAAEHGNQNAMAEALFEGYFLKAANLTQTATLAELAANAGFDREQVAAYLESDQDRELIEEQDRRARSTGVEGVPFFIFGQRYALSGAQPPDLILEVMEKVHADESATVAP
jgi:predicted DsbA family dithiol-disulfide isomerase